MKNRITRATKRIRQTLLSALRRSQAVVWEIGKVLVLVAVLIVLMLWLSGAFIDKIRAATPVTPQKAPAPAAKSQPVEMRTFPLIVDQVGTVQTRARAEVAGRQRGAGARVMSGRSEAQY